jgi:hypothetical protein
LIIVEINPQTLLQFNSTSKDIFNYLNDLGFDNYLVLKNGKLERINTYQFEETNNVLFVHNESINTSEFKELLTTS